jgi:hypothetical protein
LLELGVGADILRGIGWLIWLLIAVALGVAFTKPKTRLGKAVAVSLVLGVVASIFVPEAIRQYEHKQRYAKAKALFDERCKTAGEKIYRTVEGVEGFFLENPRRRIRNRDWADRDWIGAGFPGASGGGYYIMEFLFYNHPPKNNYTRALDWNKGGHADIDMWRSMKVTPDIGIS